jgi:hypothetical protein
MEDKWPCMHVECTEEAFYGIEFDDEIGSGTLACEQHLQGILFNKDKNKYLFHYKLEEM